MDEERLEVIEHLCELLRGCQSDKILEVIDKIRILTRLEMLLVHEGKNEKTSS